MITLQLKAVLFFFMAALFKYQFEIINIYRRYRRIKTVKIKTKTRERRLYFQNMLLSMWRYFRVNINKKPKNLSHRYYLFPHKSPFFTLIDPLKQHTFSQLWYQIKSVRLWTIKYIQLKQQQHSSSSQAKQSNCQNIFFKYFASPANNL